jgi:hypothetical protein
VRSSWEVLSEEERKVVVLRMGGEVKAVWNVVR